MALSAVPVRAAAGAALLPRADLARRRGRAQRAHRRRAAGRGLHRGPLALPHRRAVGAGRRATRTGGLLIALTSPRGALAARLRRASWALSLVVRLATRARPPLGGDADGVPRGNLLRDSLAGHVVGARRPAHPARAAAGLARAHLRGGARGAGGAVRLRARALPGGGRLVARGDTRRARSWASWWPSGSSRPPGGGGWSAALAGASFVPLLAFAGQPGLALSLLLLIVAGLCSAWVLGLDALILEVTPERLLGRVFSVNSAGLISLQGFGFAAAGALAEVVEPQRRDRDRRGGRADRGRAPGARASRGAPPRGGPESRRRATLRFGPRRPELPPSMSLRRTPLVLALVAALAAPARGVRRHDVHVQRPRLRPRRGHGPVRRPGIRAAGLDAPADPGALLPGHDARARAASRRCACCCRRSCRGGCQRARRA